MYPDFIEEEVAAIRKRNLYRSIIPIEGPQGPRIRIGGRETINLSSNDYLGLSNHPKVKEAAINAVKSLGSGACASRLVSGTMGIHLELEEAIASLKGREAALLFNSGYQANIGIIPALVGKGDILFSDRLNHASIVDASLLSRATFKRYPHLNVEILERMLMASRGYRRRLIVTEGVFSMEGDIAPLREISTLAERYNAMLLVDDAHATGVLGSEGRGTLEHLGIYNPDIIEMGTLGKAVGSFGAFVAGRRTLIDYLINRARSFIFTTALPPSVCAASLAAIDVITHEPGIRNALRERSEFFKKLLKKAGLDTMMSATHIIPILIGNPGMAIDISRKLLAEGVFIQAIRPPTVPLGTSRLRITIKANHDMKDLTYAVNTIRRVILGK